MKKYFHIYKASLINELQYARGYLISFVGVTIHIFVFFALWKYLYSSGQKEMINGYTLAQMIWYVTFTEFLTGFSSSGKIRKTPKNEIMSGNIAYTINKPYSYTGYIFSIYFAESTIKGMINLICSLVLGSILIGVIPNFNPLYIPLMIISLFLGSMIAAFIRLTISYLSFWVEDAEPFQWLFKTTFLVFGVSFPVEMFPLWLQPIVKVSPVYAALSGPCKLVVDFNINEFFTVLIAQVFYITILFLINQLVFMKGAKRVNVNGG